MKQTTLKKGKNAIKLSSYYLTLTKLNLFKNDSCGIKFLNHLSWVAICFVFIQGNLT